MRKIALMGLALIILGGAFYFYYSSNNPNSPANIFEANESVLEIASSTSTSSPATSSTIRPTSSLDVIAPTLPIPTSTAGIPGRMSDEELKERIGEMLLVGFRGTTVNSNSYIVKVIKDLEVGGVILFDYDSPSKSYPRNITNASQVTKLISDLKIFSRNPLFIAVDAEGGLVNRLKPSYGFIDIPSASSLGAKNDAAYTQQIAEQLGRQLSSLGFNLNFAPVVDVNVNPTNPIIGALGRSFSSDSAKVTTHAEAFIQGLHERGILTAIKHFPGHGSSTGDTHKGIVDVTNTYKPYELTPFRDLISKGLPDMVMTAHVINRNIDTSRPATLSPLFLKDILRRQLGWNGVVVTDDMQMGAILSSYGISEAAVLAVKAGGDILIISNNVSIYDEQAPYKVRDAIFNAVKRGDIPESSIIDSSNRIRTLKQRYGIN